MRSQRGLHILGLVYTRALARRRFGIPIGSDAAAERWSVSSVDVSLTAPCPSLPLALWAFAGSHSFFRTPPNFNDRGENDIEGEAPGTIEVMHFPCRLFLFFYFWLGVVPLCSLLAGGV